MSSWPAGKVNLSGFGLEYLQQIGAGHYGVVSLVRETSTGQSLVAKAVALGALKQKEQENAHQEVCLLQALRHPLIVAYHNSFLVDGMHTLVILMEHCRGGDLRELILKRQPAMELFPEEQVMFWFAQILLALQYMHSEKVLHRDLKTSNIFLSEASLTSVVKLGDFGISRVLEGTSDAAMSTVGTPYYMSPEVCRNDPYNWKSDVWALGCVLYEVCALKRAFESSSLAGLIYRIVNDKHDQIPTFYSQALNDLISQLLAKAVDSRPAVSDLSAVPYVNQYLQKQELAMSNPMETAHEPRAKFLVLSFRLASRLAGVPVTSTFVPFADCGAESLSKAALQSALETLSVGLSREEAAFLAEALASEPGPQISVSHLESVLAAAACSQEARQLAGWARQVLEPFRSVVAGHLRAQDAREVGVLSVAEFQGALMQLLLDVTPVQLNILVLLADKNGSGEIDYAKFAVSCSEPLHLAPAPLVVSPLSPTGQSDWGSVLEPATFGETVGGGWGNWGTCTSEEFQTSDGFATIIEDV